MGFRIIGHSAVGHQSAILSQHFRLLAFCKTLMMPVATGEALLGAVRETFNDLQSLSTPVPEKNYTSNCGIHVKFLAENSLCITSEDRFKNFVESLNPETADSKNSF